jgi:HK97 family phage prohead protease
MSASAVAIPFEADLVLTRWEEHLIKSSDTALLSPEAVQPTIQKGDWIIEGYAATDDIDSEDDKIADEALKEGAESLALYRTILYNHNKDRAIGTLLLVEAVEGRLFIRMRMSKTEPKLWEQVKDGTLSKFSVRGRILKIGREYSTAAGRQVRVIKSLKLFECSLVSVPANPHARTLRWFVAKALSEFVEQGGDLPAAEETDSGGQDMAKKDEEALQAAGTDNPEVTPPAAGEDTQQPTEGGQPPEDQATKAEGAAVADPSAETGTGEAADAGDTGEEAATDDSATDEQTQDDDPIKKKMGSAAQMIGQLLVGACKDTKPVLEAAKTIFERAVSGEYTIEIPFKDEALAKRITEIRIAALKASEVQEAAALLAHAAEKELDPIRKHFLAGVTMLMTEQDEQTQEEQPPATTEQKDMQKQPPVPPAAPPAAAPPAQDEQEGDGDVTMDTIRQAVVDLAKRVSEIGKRVEALEGTEDEGDDEEDATPPASQEEAAQPPAAKSEGDAPAEADADEQSTEATQEEQDAETEGVKALSSQLGDITTLLESLGSRLEKVEKTEGVSQSIRGQDAGAAGNGNGSLGWAGIFGGAIADAIGFRGVQS